MQGNVIYLLVMLALFGEYFSTTGTAQVTSDVIEKVKSEASTSRSTVTAKSQLIDSLEATVASFEAMSPFDFVGSCLTQDNFNEDISGLRSIRFRLQYDHAAELLNWGIEERGEDGNGAPPALISFKSLVVRDKKLYVIGGPTDVGASVDSVDSAIANNGVPLPLFWGIFQFPYFGKQSEDIRLLFGRIMDNESTVVVNQSGTELTYTLRERFKNRGPKDFALNTWKVRLPDHLPLGLRYHQELNAPPELAGEHEIFWESLASGVSVPTRIAARLGMARQKDGAYQLGFRENDANFEWLSVNSPINNIRDYDLRTEIETSKFVEEGFALAKKRWK